MSFSYLVRTNPAKNPNPKPPVTGTLQDDYGVVVKLLVIAEAGTNWLFNNVNDIVTNARAIANNFLFLNRYYIPQCNLLCFR